MSRPSSRVRPYASKRRRYTHVRTGKPYEIIGVASDRSNDSPSHGKNLVVYRSLESGRWFARLQTEFNDGRFAPLTDDPSPFAKSEMITVNRDLFERMTAQIAEANKLLNTPDLVDFAAAVQREAAHQRLRWGAEHDAKKRDADWFWLVGYLAGKALHASTTEKKLHHVVTTAAALANWHASALTKAATPLSLSPATFTLRFTCADCGGPTEEREGATIGAVMQWCVKCSRGYSVTKIESGAAPENAPAKEVVSAPQPPEQVAVEAVPSTTQPLSAPDHAAPDSSSPLPPFEGGPLHDPGRRLCTRCDGCGCIADSKDGEPWTAWENLPPGSDAAVRLGLVRPIPCPACGGKGGTQP